jgi:hypothetical protein
MGKKRLANFRESEALDEELGKETFRRPVCKEIDVGGERERERERQRDRESATGKSLLKRAARAFCG